MIEIEGLVSDPDGRPVQNALLDFWADFPSPGHEHSARSTSDGAGGFVVKLSKDERYMVRVGPEGEGWARVQFVADGGPIKITARPR
jgi:hypothetical protein